MRSLRLSLLAYFLLLVSAGLGVAMVMLDGVAQRTLMDKEDAAAKLIEERYQKRVGEARNVLHDRLLAHAQLLAGRARPRERWESIRERHGALRSLSLLTTSLSPFAYATVPLGAAQYGEYKQRPERYHLRVLGSLTAATVPNGYAALALACAPSLRRESPGPSRYFPPALLQARLWWCNFFDLKLSEDVEHSDESTSPRIVSRIQTNGYSAQLNLPAQGDFILPDETDFAPDERWTFSFDRPTLDDGTQVERVRFRALMRLQVSGGPPGPPGPPVPPGPPIPPPGQRMQPAALIISCAANVRDLETVIDTLREQRDAERETLTAETAAAMTYHRSRLLLICAFTFVATILGCVGLVWVGLRPLNRLSDAVKQLSPKNFALELGNRPMPDELKPIVATLRTSLDALGRAFQREKQATADISHELRTPLAALLTTVELALRKPRSAEAYRELLEDAHASAKQMHTMVERLLTLARLDAGVDRLRAQRVNVGELAEQCACMVRPLAEAKGLALTVENGCPHESEDAVEAGAVLTTDPDKLREILNNLLHNAVQYNRPDGRIGLRVVRSGDHLEMEVSDTGIGIPPDARDRIFERFFRADPSRNTDGLNSGLGLAIVKEYVDLMGGSISVESREGEGSTFRLKLPAA